MSSYTILKMRISAVQYEQILDQMDLWIHEHDKGHYVMFANVHSVMECQNSSFYEKIAAEAGLVSPDGTPLVVIGRLRGFPLKQRADGPGLMLKAMDVSTEKEWRHYFYGGTPQTLELILQRLQKCWPHVQVAGSYAPPFRPLTTEEDNDVTAKINSSRADVLWVGLGCPKQEIWMWEHRNRLNVPVMLGVGQAFDLLAKVKNRAPKWMCNSGLEWFYRIVTEPRRLWKRYLVNNSRFLGLVLAEEIKLKARKSS